MAPKMARARRARACALAMATIGPTARRSRPSSPAAGCRTSGSRPALDQRDQAAAEQVGLISIATCSGLSLSARPTISGTATAPAYITSTCCRPSAARRRWAVVRPQGGRLWSSSRPCKGLLVVTGASCRLQLAGAPASNQRLISARSSSVIWVALFSGMSLSTTTCWYTACACCAAAGRVQRHVLLLHLGVVAQHAALGHHRLHLRRAWPAWPAALAGSGLRRGASQIARPTSSSGAADGVFPGHALALHQRLVAHHEAVADQRAGQHQQHQHQPVVRPLVSQP
jgi:hypothetical protein